MKTIGVVTTSRADYAIYRPILTALEHAMDFELRLFVSGMHLTDRFGQTVHEVERDGFTIQKRIESLMDTDSPAAVGQSMGRALSGFAQAFEEWQPDILLVLGDRFEMQPAALAALPFGIPVAHIHGGELTLGAIDDALRHTLTKLSHLHFPSTEMYAQRIRQLGEEPWRITMSGAPGLDNLKYITPLSNDEFLKRHGPRLSDPFVLVTYHPETLDIEHTNAHFKAILDGLESTNFPILFTLANADTGGSAINQMIRKFTARYDKAWYVTHLGLEGYFTAMTHALVMIGNSSSGLIEAPSFGLPVVNIGKRQDGRVRGKNVVDVGHSTQDIIQGIQRALAPSFRETLRDRKNPYGDGQASPRILEALRKAPERHILLAKKFYEPSFEVP